MKVIPLKLPLGALVHVNHYHGEIIAVEESWNVEREDIGAFEVKLREPLYVVQFDLSKKHEWANDVPQQPYDTLMKKKGRLKLFRDEFKLLSFTTDEKTELELQAQVKQFIDQTYPHILVLGNPLAGLGVESYHFQQRLQQLGGADLWPDLFVAEPRGPYHGMFLELKAPNARFLFKNGEPEKPSARKQLEILQNLNAHGYYAAYAHTLAEACHYLDAYLSEEKPRNVLPLFLSPAQKRAA